jgi:hypothetical protein
MSDEDTKVVDLNSRRLDKALQNTGGFTVVQLIACSNCQGTDFKLTHEHQIACAGCNIVIEPLRWYDVNVPPDTPVA